VPYSGVPLVLRIATSGRDSMKVVVSSRGRRSRLGNPICSLVWIEPSRVIEDRRSDRGQKLAGTFVSQG
jgi:hypothetical protein